MVSTGDGRTTCSYFFPGDKRILYSSTHLGAKQCPPKPDFSQGYVWAVYDTFDIFTANADGSDIRQLTKTPGYDAETTISRKGKLVFTSKRDGDLDIYTMDANGRNVKRLTNELGYDGGPFWSYDGKQIVYRAYHPQTEKEKADYVALLKQNLIRPTVLDIWVMNADGSNKRQVTHLNKASFAPYFFPDGKRIIFSSNDADPKGPRFRSLRDQDRRHRARAHHLQRHVRWLPDVFAQRQEVGVRFESQRSHARRHEYFHSRLG